MLCFVFLFFSLLLSFGLVNAVTKNQLCKMFQKKTIQVTMTAQFFFKQTQFDQTSKVNRTHSVSYTPFSHHLVEWKTSLGGIRLDFQQLLETYVQNKYAKRKRKRLGSSSIPGPDSLTAGPGAASAKSSCDTSTNQRILWLPLPASTKQLSNPLIQVYKAFTDSTDFEREIVGLLVLNCQNLFANFCGRSETTPKRHFTWSCQV